MRQRAWRCAMSGVFLLTILAAVNARGQYARYVDAYNRLARGANERSAASGVDAGTPLRYIGPGDTLRTADVQLLRHRVLKMLQQAFVLGPDDFNLSARDPGEAFPPALRRAANGDAIGRHLMEEVGDGKGRFTKVPAEYMASDKTLYSADSWDPPMLWIHFKELEAVMARMRYTLVSDGQYTGWYNTANEPNQRGGYACDTNWQKTCETAWSTYQDSTLTPAVGGPESWIIGVGPRQGFDYYATIRNRKARYTIAGLYDGIDRRVTLYLRPARLHVPDDLLEQFDPCGWPLAEERWTAFSVVAGVRDNPIVSQMFGGTPVGGNCAEPAWEQTSTRGFNIEMTRGCVEWDFTPVTLDPLPEGGDNEDEGLCVTGCECTGCPPEADPAWEALRASARVRFPLGLSSGLLSGGLRLKAYLTEYTMNGVTQQMYSLNTGVPVTIIDILPDDRWGFSVVKRPSGAEVMFALYGKGAGRPVDGNATYRLTYQDPTHILTFSGADGGLVEHKFFRGTLSHVILKKGKTEIVADGSSFYWRWPGLQAAFSGARLERVESPALTAVVTAYAGDLVRAVEYRYKPAGPTNTLCHYVGSRGFRTVNEYGQTIGDVRVVENAGGVEIWRGLTAGPAPRALLKERRSEWRDAVSGVRVLTETTVINDGQPDADSNITLSTMAAFPWGEERVSRTEGYGWPEARTTRYAYGTNRLDPAAYGRLILREDPDGGWTAYEYDDGGRERRVRTAWKNSLPGDTNACRVTEYYRAGDPALPALGYPAETVAGFDDRPRLIVERIGPQETARRYVVHAAGSETVRECLNPGAAYDDPSNRTTVTRFMTAWPYVGRPASVDYPDGTRSLYSYAMPAGGLAITEDRGVGSGAAITNGIRSIRTLDSLERVVSETRIDIASGITNDATVYTYDALGRVLCVSNRLTGTATLTQPGCCGPERVVDPEGIATVYGYDELKRPYAVERLGVTVFQSYDTGGRVTETRRCAAGVPDRVTRVEYDKAGEVRRSIDERGLATTHSDGTNAAGERVHTAVAPDGATRAETFYRDGQLKSVAGTGQPPLCYDYGVDDEGPFTIEYHGADTNAAQWVRTTTDRLGRTVRVTQADGYTRTTVYDALGRPARETDGLTLSLLEQDALGRVVRQAVDMNGNGALDPGGSDHVTETEMGYARQEGRPVRTTVIRVWDEAGSSLPRETARTLASLDGRTSWSIAFDRTTRVDVVRNPAEAWRHETTLAPDGTRTVALYTNGLLVAVRRETAGGLPVAAQRLAYDVFEHLARVEDTGPDGAPRVTTHGYDAAGNVTNVTMHSGGRTVVTAHVYDEAGRCVRTVLPDGSEDIRTYESGGALAGRFGTSAYPVRYGYDTRGRLAWQATYRAGTNGAPDLTQWAYDAQRGWLTERVQADGSAQRYDYLPNGSLKRRITARGVTVDYAYDPAGGLTNTSYGDATPSVAVRRDRLGRPVEIADGTGTRRFEYRPDDQPAGETFPLAGGRVDWGYDAVGRRAHTAVSNEMGAGAAPAVGYAYDEAGRLAEVTWGAFSAGYRYGEDGTTVAGVTLGRMGDAVLEGARTHDGLGRLTNLAWTARGTLVDGFSYEYDAAGRRTRCLLADGRAWTYEYDPRGQVVAARLTGRENALEPAVALEYAYDTIGNRTRMQANGRETTYTANALNQYTGFDFWGTGLVARVCGTVFSFGSGVSLAGTAADVRLASPVRTAMAYDADGNLAELTEAVDGVPYATSLYTWDAESRLVQVSNGQIRVSFAYDALGRRVGKTVFTNVSGAWVRSSDAHYVYDGWNVIQEIRRQDSEVSTNGYLWGLDLSGTLQGAGGIGGLLAASFGGTTAGTAVCYGISDANGNVTGWTDTNGTKVASYEYGAFGEVLQATGPTASENPWRFSTRYTDIETGLVMYPSRLYSPTLGRWLSRDPIEEAGGINLYAFVGNAPLDFVDPWGLALYAIDGTWADAEARNPKRRDETNVHRFYLRSGEKPKRYQRGPGAGQWFPGRTWHGAAGTDSDNIRDDVYDQVCEDFCKAKADGKDFTVNLVGWSRGATICLGLAQKLNDRGCKCPCGEKGVFFGLFDRTQYITHKPVQVNWVGLFDAVEMIPNPAEVLPGDQGWPNVVPPNVKQLDHARKTARQRIFPTTRIAGENARDFLLNDGARASHNDIGAQLNNRALEWMIERAHGAGVDVQ